MLQAQRLRMTHRSADFQSAVSPICNRLGLEHSAALVFAGAAEYNSAIQQIENLRYVTEHSQSCFFAACLAAFFAFFAAFFSAAGPAGAVG